ncbi:MAG: O-antigen ligase family protein, partial [Archangium sp.]|nr:O-antigen ligase family protein [Archangium sp.]
SALEWLKLPFHRVYEPVPNAEGRFMGGGLLFHRLKFAHVSSLAVLALTVVGAKTSGRVRLVAWAVAALGTIAVWFFPYARMASVALAASLLVTVALVTPNRRRAVIAAAIIVVLGAATVAAVEPLRARFLSALTTEGSGDRKELLEAGLRAIEAHPFTGVGAGQFRPSLFAPEGVPQYVLDNPGKAHNQFVSMAAEVGIPGALLFVLMLSSLAFAARRAPLGVLTLSGLTFFTLLSLAHDPLFQAPFSMALVLVAGAGLAVPRRGDVS